MSPRRRRVPPYLDIVPLRLNIFVPALMSVGFLFWMGAVARDQFRRRSALALERRAQAAGAATAAVTAGRRPSSEANTIATSDRRAYLLAALPFLALAVYVLVGAVGNYFRPDGYVANIAWLLAIAVLVSFAATWIATVLAALAYQWPAQSPTLRRLSARAPIGGSPERDARDSEPSSLLSVALAVTASAAALAALVVGSARSWFASVDDELLDAATDAAWLDWVSDIDPLGSTVFTIIAAALLGIASFRCRVLVAAYPLAVVSGLLANALLRLLVERPRPPEGPFAGRFDSFPSGHIVMTTVLVGLLPLTISVMAHSTRVVRPMRVVAVVAVLATALHRVHDEAHWPSDAVGSIFIGATIVVAVEWAIADGAWHRSCSDCPSRPHVTEVALRRGTVPVHVDTARLINIVAHVAAASVALLLVVLTVTEGIPTNPEGALIDIAVQRPTQLALAGMVSVGALISWRFPALGAVLLAIAASGLGIFAAVQYQPSYAFALSVVIMIPAVLLWLSWQHHRTRLEIGALAVITLLALFGTWVGASAVYDSAFGPTHADSAAVLLPVDRVEWVWSGGLGPESISVVARLDDDEYSARLVVRNEDRTWTTPAVRPDDGDLVRFRLEDLDPDRAYTYRVEVDGRLDESRGQGSFRTPAEGAESFRVVLASCARTDSNGAVFDAIVDEDPLLYLALGDFHYANIAQNDIDLFRAAYDRTLTSPGQAALYRNVPISYVWDDHDYGPNDADGASPSRDAARRAFKESVPSHPLVSEDGAIHRAFTIGRVRFVVSDTRSERIDDTMLGSAQLTWLQQELVEASRTHGLVVWMNPTPWIGAAAETGDGWAAFADERRRIADALAAADVENLVMVSGDAHMLAYDDGTNSAYASDGSRGFPVLHAAALDRPGSIKGGPYSSGAFPGSGQYGVIDIDDDGERIEVTLTGKTWEGEVLISERLSFPAP